MPAHLTSTIKSVSVLTVFIHVLKQTALGRITVDTKYIEKVSMGKVANSEVHQKHQSPSVYLNCADSVCGGVVSGHVN